MKMSPAEWFSWFLSASGIFAFLVCGPCAAVSLAFWGFGGVEGQLLFGWLAEMAGSALLLVLGIALSKHTWNVLRSSEESPWGRALDAFSSAFIGFCWIVIGLRGLSSSEILSALFTRL